jgi:hypothetical protein
MSVSLVLPALDRVITSIMVVIIQLSQERCCASSDVWLVVSGVVCAFEAS